MPKNDVVIIGGSLAGAACARELNRLGVDAVALERDTFPRAKVCGGFLSPNAVDCLQKLGLLDAVRAAGAATVDRAHVNVEGTHFEIPFQRPGLGISRSALDHILATNAPVEQGRSVLAVERRDSAFRIETNTGRIEAKLVIDAAGKLSRFTRRTMVPEFGIQYLENSTRGTSLDFWFFEDGYGGAVTVEGGQSNFSFLIKKESLNRYLAKPGKLVTGPFGYDRVPGDAIAIGDAAGMIDPFSGEGMHHAFDSGMTAARIVARGLRDRRTVVEMRQAYDLEWSRRWSGKRLLVGAMRRAIGHSKAVRFGLSLNPRWFLDRLWATIPS